MTGVAVSSPPAVDDSPVVTCGDGEFGSDATSAGNGPATGALGVGWAGVSGAGDKGVVLRGDDLAVPVPLLDADPVAADDLSQALIAQLQEKGLLDEVSSPCHGSGVIEPSSLIARSPATDAAARPA